MIHEKCINTQKHNRERERDREINNYFYYYLPYSVHYYLSMLLLYKNAYLNKKNCGKEQKVMGHNHGLNLGQDTSPLSHKKEHDIKKEGNNFKN